MVVNEAEKVAEESPVIGYSTDGRLIRGGRQDRDGRFLVPFVRGEYARVQMANELDRIALSATVDDVVVTIWKSSEAARRYLARNALFLSMPSQEGGDNGSE